MIKISITEKLWDGVRPSSVKKTGLSEAIRDATKLLAKPLDTPKAYTDADAAVVELKNAIDGAAVQVKKASDDKKNAGVKLKEWSQECDQARKDLADLKAQTGLLKVVNAADEKMRGLLKEVETLHEQMTNLCNDLGSGKQNPTPQILAQLQKARSAYRDGYKASQKDGFPSYIGTLQVLIDWGSDAHAVPLPPAAKEIRPKLDALGEACEQVRMAVERHVGKDDEQRDADAREAIKPLLKLYEEINGNIKATIPAAKKMAVDAASASQKFKELLGKGITHDKLVPIITSIHVKALGFEEKIIQQTWRGRKDDGDAQKLRVRLREQWPKDSKPRNEFELMSSERWNVIMITSREATEELGKVHLQVDRVLRLIGESSTDAALITDELAKTWRDEIKSMRGKYS